MKELFELKKKTEENLVKQWDKMVAILKGEVCESQIQSQNTV
jgi:hypothetical protein